MQKNIFIILVAIATFLFGMQIGFANGLQLPDGANDIIQKNSISIWNNSFESTKNVKEIRGFGFSLLMLAKTIISGFALIYIVFIGAYMVIYSEEESVITKQKQQIIYVLLGFLFLNLPTLIYDVFITPSSVDANSPTNWKSTSGSEFWNIDVLSEFGGALMGFFRVLVYIVAVGMFTWSAFTLIGSRGKEEYKKTALNRFLYGGAALFFLWIAEAWIKIMSSESLSPAKIFDNDVAGQIFKFLFFLAGPVAIFFLIIWAYYYITSAGDEEKAKKGKNIVINTVIATVLLLASFSFISELSNFFK